MKEYDVEMQTMMRIWEEQKKLENEKLGKPFKKRKSRDGNSPHYEAIKESIVNYQQKNPIKTILATTKQNALKKGIEFNIKVEDLEIPDECPYLGTFLTNIRNHGRVKTNMSVERKDPTKGYVKGNVEVISDLANRMKQDASIAELVDFAHSIIQYYGGSAAYEESKKKQIEELEALYELDEKQRFHSKK